MSIALAIVLNVALLAVVLPWLWRQWCWAGATWWRVVFAIGFLLRIGVGVTRSWTPKLDAEFMMYLAGLVTDKVASSQAVAMDTLFGAVNVFRIVHEDGTFYDAVYQSFSNTWFLVKILGLLNFASLKTGAFNGLYLSLFAFVGCWRLARSLAEVLPKTPAGAGVVAFLFWPSVWFWATGISKEAVLLGSGAWLTARILDWLYGRAMHAGQGVWLRFWWWLGTAALAYLHFKMRYFFAVPLLGVLAGVALGHFLERLGLGQRRWVQAVVLAAVLAAGVWIAPEFSSAFSLNKFTNQVIKVYTFEVAHSIGKPHFDYPDLRPTIESIAAHAPLAVANALTRPWLGESRQLTYIIAGLENAAVLTLLVLALTAGIRGRAGRMPFGLGLGLAIFCVILAFLMGITTPNLGALNRYRCELLAFLVLLLLQNDYAAAIMRRLGLGSEANADLEQPKKLARPVA